MKMKLVTKKNGKEKKKKEEEDDTSNSEHVMVAVGCTALLFVIHVLSQ
jgi:hypothetical protein